MIAACPKCAARYRVDPKRIGTQGARLRCARCEAIFRVRVPSGGVPSLAETTRPEPSPASASAGAEAAGAQAPGHEAGSLDAPTVAADAPASARDRLVLLADSEVEEGKRNAAALAAWGLEAVLVHDGVEAMLAIQRLLPRAVILDAALPKMFGFQICEVVKRNESLRDTHVILVGSPHHPDRYRRSPSELYGADVYMERADLPEQLPTVLQRFGLAVDPADGQASSVAPPRPVVEASVAQPEREAAPAAPSGARATPAAAPTTSAAAPPPADDALAEERAKAERLARIIVSDIVLYNPEKFDAAVRTGNVLQALDSGLEEGRELFRQRIDERVRTERDYLEQELLRVARERGAQ